MSNAYNVFLQNIQEVNLIDKFYNDILRANPILQSNLDDILRIELVNVISAMDNYFHKLVKDGIIEAYFNRRIRTDKWKNATMTLKNVVDFVEIEKEKANSTINQIEYETGITELLYNYYSEIFKTMSFQQQNKISDALSYIWTNTHKIQDIVQEINNIGYTITNDDFNTKLKLIIDQRNRIAHEADWDPINQRKYPIHHQDVINSTLFISSFVQAVDNIDNTMILLVP